MKTLIIMLSILLAACGKKQEISTIYIRDAKDFQLAMKLTGPSNLIIRTNEKLPPMADETDNKIKQAARYVFADQYAALEPHPDTSYIIVPERFKTAPWWERHNYRWWPHNVTSEEIENNAGWTKEEYEEFLKDIQ